MTRRKLKRAITIVVSFYIAVLAGYVALRLCGGTGLEKNIADILKDTMTLIVAIPAAWLGFCFQRRSAYLQQIRALWSDLVAAVQDAISYTHSKAHKDTEYAAVLNSLSRVIDELRGAFTNIELPGSNIGIYPYEPIKEIHRLITVLKYGDEFETVNAEDVREEIVARWKAVREPFLYEFDRDFPSYDVSSYLKRPKKTD